MAKHNLNISLGVDVAELKKGFEEAIKVTQKASNETEKAAKEMAAGVVAQLDKIGNSKSLKSVQREMFNLLTTLEQGGDAMKPVFNEVLRHAGDVRDRITDLNLQIEASTPDGPFKALNNTLQGSAGLFAATQGAMALFGNESEDLQKVLVKIQAAMAMSEGLKSIESLKDGFMQLKVVMLANPIMTIATVLTTVTAATVALVSEMDNLSAAEQALIDLNQRAAASIAAEKAEIDMLAFAYDDANTTAEERRKIYDLLSEKSDIFKNGLDAEGNAMGRATALAGQYTEKLLQQAKIKASLELVEEAYKKVIDAEKELIRKQKGDLDFSDYASMLGNLSQGRYQSAQSIALNEAEANLQKFKKGLAETEAQVKKLAIESIKAGGSVAEALGYKTPKAQGTKSKPLENAGKLSLPDFTVQAKSIDHAAQAFEKYNLASFKAIDSSKVINISMRKQAEEMVKVSAMVGDALRQMQQVMVDGMTNTVSAIVSGGDISSALGQMLGGVLGVIGDFMIEYGTKSAVFLKLMTDIQGAIASGLGIAGLPAAIAMIGAGIALKGISQSFGQKVPKYADGGIAFGQTIGMFGEYPNANINPEVVAPLSDLKAMLSGGGDSNIGGQLVARVSGNDLLFIIEKAEKNRRRG